MKIRFLIILFFFVIPLRPSYGGESICVALADALKSHLNLDVSNDSVTKIRRYFKSDKFVEDVNSGKWQGSVGFSGLQFGAGEDSSSISKMRDYVESMTDDELISNVRVRLASSGELSQDIQRSLVACAQKEAGHFGWTVALNSDNPKELVTFSITYRRLADNDPLPTPRSLDVINVDPADVRTGLELDTPMTNGSATVAARRDPSKAIVLFIVTNKGDIIQEVQPFKMPTPTLTGGTPTPKVFPDFDGDGVVDRYEVHGTSLIVHMSKNSRDVVIQANNPDYHAEVGFWMAGDFNGDGFTDLIHMVTPYPGNAGQYCHVHFSDSKGGFKEPTTFKFPPAANPQQDYHIELGHWDARDLNGDGKCDLEHNPALPDHRIHKWISIGDGTFKLH